MFGALLGHFGAVLFTGLGGVFILFALANLNRCKPQERRSSHLPGSATHRPDEDDHGYPDD